MIQAAQDQLAALELDIEHLSALNDAGVCDLFFDAQAIKEKVAALESRATCAIETLKQVLVNRAESSGLQGFPHARGSITVKEKERINVSPEHWDKIGPDLRQKRVLTAVLEERIRNGDPATMDLIAIGAITITPIKEVSFRRTNKGDSE